MMHEEKQIEANVLCVIYDEVADLNSAPLTFTNEASGIRYFANKCKVDNTGSAKDLVLYHIGYYNEKNAKVVVLDQPIKLAKGLDYVKEE